MVRPVGRIENHATIKDWQNPLYALFHVAIPKFQMTAILFMPIRIEINLQIDAPIEVQPVVLIKIRVNLEEASSLNLM